MQKLDPMHIEIVEYSAEVVGAGGREYHSRLEEDREYLMREYRQDSQQEYIKAEPGKEQDFIALVNDSIGYCYDTTSHQVIDLKMFNLVCCTTKQGMKLNGNMIFYSQ
jgi:hypothetical protein